MKESNKYYFSVEGDTEKAYLTWLSKAINSDDTATSRVSFDVRVGTNPVKHVKRLTITGKTIVTHLFDFECNDEDHINRFISTLKNMKEASKVGRTVTYNTGYTNLSFELWLILHKEKCNAPLISTAQYLPLINKIFNCSYQSPSEFKEQNNFECILNTLTLHDVKRAIVRAEEIFAKHQVENNCRTDHGYKWTKETPALDIHLIIKEILKTAGL